MGQRQSLARAQQVSSVVMRNIRQKLIFAFARNMAGFPVAPSSSRIGL